MLSPFGRLQRIPLGKHLGKISEILRFAQDDEEKDLVIKNDLFSKEG